MLFHGDIAYAKIWYANVKEQRRSCQSQIHGENMILITRSYRGHTEVMDAKKIVKNPLNLTLGTKVNVLLGS